MSDAPRDIPTILTERLALIQAIAAQNSENLRLNQIASGMMVLDQKDEEDSVDGTDRDREWDATDAALTECRNKIEQLEAQLADLDRQLEKATQGLPK